MDDRQILEQLRTPDPKRSLVALYKHLPKVERMIREAGGTRSDAKDLFQEALIILIGKAKDDSFQLNCSISTFLHAICRNKWHEELRRRGRFSRELEAAPNEPTDLLAEVAEDTRTGLAERALRSLGEKCLDVLKRFYLMKEPLSTIASAIGLAGEGAAKTRKYKCLEEARKRYRALMQRSEDLQPQTI